MNCGRYRVAYHGWYRGWYRVAYRLGCGRYREAYREGCGRYRGVGVEDRECSKRGRGVFLREGIQLTLLTGVCGI